MSPVAPPLGRVIALLARLPGLGPKSAQRVALHLLRHRDRLLLPLAGALQEVAALLQRCGQCGNLDTSDPCGICSDSFRDGTRLCVVETIADLWAMERSRAFNGLYHILGGSISVIRGRVPETLMIEQLVSRVGGGGIAEVIIATSATIDGQTTAHYLVGRLAPLGVPLSRIAFGVPIGGELDYLDEGTLSAALAARRPAWSQEEGKGDTPPAPVSCMETQNG